MEKIIESLKQGKHNPEELVFKNMKSHQVYKNRPYLKNGLNVFAVENELTVDEKVVIIDIFTDGVASYMLGLINKWEEDKKSLPKDQYGHPKTVSEKAWLKRNDTKNITKPEYKSRYYLFGSRFDSFSLDCPSTAYGYDMEFTGEHVVHQWFHGLCKDLLKKELKWFSENDNTQLKINKLKELGHRHRTVFNSKLLNDIVYNCEQNASEEQLDKFIEAYTAVEKTISEQTAMLKQALGSGAMYEEE